MSTKKGLGKGLNALFADNKPIEENEQNQMNEQVHTLDASSTIELELHKIEPNRAQPRKFFDADKLDELTESIKNFGIIQPIIVKKEDGYYSIIAGERRWRAARQAGLTSVPVVVKDYTEIESLEAALIENIQRADLNPIEESVCYQKLIEEYSFSQEQLAKRVGKNRTYISNALRLLTLNEKVKIFIIEEKLSMGHARTLIPITDKQVQFDMAEKIIEENLSVRQTEELIRNYFESISQQDEADDNTDKKTVEPRKSHIVTSAEKELETLLGTNVNIKDGKRKGKIEIDYYSQDEFDRLLILFKKIQE